MGRKEKGLEAIDEMLQDGEHVVAHVYGVKCDPPTGTSGKVAGALAVTNRRIVFAGKSIASRLNHSLPLNTVTSVELNKGVMFTHIKVTLAGSYENYLVKYLEAEDFMAKTQAALMEVHAPVAQPSAATGAASVADELSKLSGLRDQGILSDDEFQAAKQRLLGG